MVRAQSHAALNMPPSDMSITVARNVALDIQRELVEENSARDVVLNSGRASNEVVIALGRKSVRIRVCDALNVFVDTCYPEGDVVDHVAKRPGHAVCVAKRCLT